MKMVHLAGVRARTVEDMHSIAYTMCRSDRTTVHLSPLQSRAHREISS